VNAAYIKKLTMADKRFTVKRASYLFTRSVLTAFVALLGMQPAPGLAIGGDIALVVRPDTPADNLSLSEVRDLLLGERQSWNGRLRVTLLVRAPAARERDVVLKVVYHMTEGQFRQYWISKVFRAESASGPKIVYSNEMATDLVLSIPGSIAFVDAAQVPKGLKILKIDGKLPGEKGYPLR
jgi:ABC-type phosphate transport system substrate-binding protein